MTTKTATKHVPKLRFPGFEGEWDEKSLNEVATFYNGRAYKQEELLEKGKYRVLRVGNFFTNTNWYYSDMELDDTKYCEKGDLLYAWSASFGPRIWQGEKVIYHYHIWKVLKKENIDKKFLFIMLDYETGKIKSQTANGLGLLHITKGAIESWKCSFPELSEQQKIAGFLTAVDDRLDQLRRKKQLLQQYKTGLMQQLFSQTLRFTNDHGYPYPDWEEKCLKDVCEINPKNSDLPESFIYIDLESVDRGTLLYTKTVNKNAAPSRAQRLLNKHDVLFQMVRPYQRNNYYFECEGDYVASTGYAQLRAFESAAFLYQLIHTNNFVNEVLERCTGSNYPAINSSDLGNIPIMTPHPDEQEKIAHCLTTLDARIQHVAQQLAHTQAFKQGLLQQLFV